MKKITVLLLTGLIMSVLSKTAIAGIISTGPATNSYGSTENNIITQAFNLDDSATETVLDSFDLFVSHSSSNTYYGVFFELETGSAKILSRTNLSSVAVSGSHSQFVNFAVDLFLDVNKTYGIGVWATQQGGRWGGTVKSTDPQWLNHTFWSQPSASVGALPHFNSGHDWAWDFSANLNMSSVSVPAPASLLLLSLGLVVIGFTRNRKAL